MKAHPTSDPSDLPTASALTPGPTAGASVAPPQIPGYEILGEVQAAGLHAQLDTRTDVYSLGVVFYRLITGSFPYSVNASVLETLRNIRECDPVRPSKIVRHLDRDIEAIILRAPAKKPDRRYQSVAELKGDIDRRLAGMPILARSDSSLYLLRKVIARHRYSSAVVLLLVVVVLGFLCFSMQRCVGLRRASRDLGEQEQLFIGQTEEFTRYAAFAVLGQFLNRWHNGDEQSAERFVVAFAEGTREAIAVRFLADERPLSEKITEFRDEL